MPAYNEVDTIAAVLDGVRAIGEAIVVDDASTDGTGDSARAEGAIVIRQKINRGYDAALNRGFSEAAARGYSRVITMDADGQHAPRDVQAVAKALNDGNEIVLGVRSRPARFAEYLFSAVTRLRWGVRDPLCGLKGYSMTLYDSLGHFDRCGATGTELMLHGLRLGFQPVQVDIVCNRRADKPRFGSSIKANFRIILSLMRVFSQRPLNLSRVL